MEPTAEPAPESRIADRIVVVALVVGALFVVFGVLLALGGNVLADSVKTFARFGMVANILAAAALGFVWFFRRKEIGEPSAEDVAAFRIADLELDDDSSLGRLESTSQQIAALDRQDPLDAIELVRELLSCGFSLGASDIHITPESHRLNLQFRIDGVLHDVGSVDRKHTPFVINRVKVLARLSIHVHSRPQDGRFTFDSEHLQARVSTLPTNHGEKAVIRLAVNDERRYKLENTGFDERTLMLYQTLLAREHGVIYLTGPTGSGKTSTLYASMMYLREKRGDTVNLVTLEDPMEVDFRGIAQTQVNNAVGLTFAVGLRSILRQDPDVIMVGEIRDEETALTAIRAGLTGHLLLTTVHADSSAGVFQRLVQLKVDPFQVAGASIAVVNQRLAIRNCASCTEPADISELQRKQLELLGVTNQGPFFRGRGCPACNGKGRRGRLPLIEVLPVTDRIRELIIAGTSKHAMEEAAVAEGMVTLGMQAMERAHAGHLHVDEVIRVLSL